MKTLQNNYPDGSSFEDYILESDHAIATVDPVGGYVTSWKVKKHVKDRFTDILYRGSSKKRTGIPILFPYFGKAKLTRQHGFGRDSTWNVQEVSDSHISLQLTAEDISEDAKCEYPYKFEAAIIVKVSDKGDLLYTLYVKNLDTKDLPISPGIHPYWDIQHEEKKNIRVEGIEEFNASEIDWDKNPPDVNYTFPHKVILHFPDRKITIKDIGTPHVVKDLVVWSQPIDKPDFNFVCFEPVCGGNFAIDESPILIKPNASWSMNLSFSANIA